MPAGEGTGGGNGDRAWGFIPHVGCNGFGKPEDSCMIGIGAFAHEFSFSMKVLFT
jgi:hypothetical protein